MANAPQRPPSDLVWTLSGETMGTSWLVRAVPPPGASEDALRQAIQSELDTAVAVFSHWDPTAEVARFNDASPGGRELGPDLWPLLDTALDLADDTNGAVDPTLGALADLWGFGPAGPRADLPAEAEIEAALRVSGWRKLRLDRPSRTAVQPGGMRLDFSGIAKGLTVDRVSDRLIAEGATSHLVEIGGELKGVGVKPDAQPWWVEIERPADLTAPRIVAALVDVAMATSGDYVRGYEVGGRRYAHTLDGSTGRPVDNGLVSVTVLHTSAMRADALATALTVMGPYDGPDYAASLDLAAHFVERTPRGLIERMTPAFAAMLDEGDAG